MRWPPILCAGLGRDPVEHVDVVHLTVSDVDEGRDVSAQIGQRMYLDGGHAAAEASPSKQAQA